MFQVFAFITRLNLSAECSKKPPLTMKTKLYRIINRMFGQQFYVLLQFFVEQACDVRGSIVTVWTH